eukprot:674014-Ditylum_brightwellii.AAC.1
MTNLLNQPALSGSQVTTTHHKWLFHEYKNIKVNTFLYDAGKKMTHKVICKGHMKIPNDDGSHSRVHAWYTPTMPTTVLSLEEVAQRH